MENPKNLQPRLRRNAEHLLRGLSSKEREDLLIKCWMSHDARWFMAAAREFGMQATNRINKTAAREVGKVEALRILRALKLSEPRDLDGYLLAQEALIAFLGPDLLDYKVIKFNDRDYQVQVSRCFAYENARRAKVAEEMDCGIFARITGWTEGLGVAYELRPSLGRCLMAQGRECIHTVSLLGENPDGGC